MSNQSETKITIHSPPKSRQEEAFEYVTKTFIKLVENDSTIHDKKDIMAFWQDCFDYPGVRENMIQAFSNFLFDIDDKMDAARKAGIMQVRDVIQRSANLPKPKLMTPDIILTIIDGILLDEDQPEERPINGDDVAKEDLSEVGGGDENDEPLI